MKSQTAIERRRCISCATPNCLHTYKLSVKRNTELVGLKASQIGSAHGFSITRSLCLHFSTVKSFAV